MAEQRSSKFNTETAVPLLLLATVVVWLILDKCPTNEVFFIQRVLIALFGGWFGKFIKGRIQSKAFGGLATAGYVIFCIVFLAKPNWIFIKKDKCNSTFNFRVKVSTDRDIKPKFLGGKVILTSGRFNSNKELTILGEADFVDIPAEYKDERASLSLELKDWQLLNGTSNQMVNLENTTQTVLIEPSDLLCCVNGYVKNGEGLPLADVKIVVLGKEFFTDKNGWFTIKMPKSARYRTYNVSVSLEGYRTNQYQLDPLSNETNLTLYK